MGLSIYLVGDPVKTICSYCGSEYTENKVLYSANITHNLTDMAEEAGIYETLWRPDELGYKKAKELIPNLTEGLAKLEKDPDYYKKFNSPNGWGMYEHFVPFVRKLLEACEEHPEAAIDVSR